MGLRSRSRTPWLIPDSVYLLVPLKHALKRLSLSVNPDITSESVPAMLLLENLEFLSILDTGVDMVGLRLIAKTIYEESRTIDIEIPYACETYIDSTSPVAHSRRSFDANPPSRPLVTHRLAHHVPRRHPTTTRQRPNCLRFSALGDSEAESRCPR